MRYASDCRCGCEEPVHLPPIVYLVLPEAVSRGSVSVPHPHLVGQNIDTFIGNARIDGDFPDDLAGQLEDLKRRSQEAEEDMPTRGSLRAKSSSSSRTELGDSGGGSCIRPASTSMSALASSPTSSPRRASPRRSCGSTRLERLSRCSMAFSLISSRSPSSCRSVRFTSVSTWRAGNYRSMTCPPSSPAAVAKDCGWAPMPLMRSWTPAWKRGAVHCAQRGASAIRRQTVGNLRLQQGRASRLLYLRQDGGDCRLAQGLDAGSLDQQWLGWESLASPAWSFATSVSVSAR